ncbi:MAG: 4-amino-4-deoxy-L-arabinose transferase-like glycosyltransferase [Cyclobacteriaceae bacterium]|jgi:4-amino-4-deoxy-L-arabinose transferase-like glycosyltransferase
MNQSIDNLIKKYFWWVFFIMLAFALISHLDHLPLKFEEPRRGIVAMEMEFTGNYITPTINGEFYYNKPPIYNWILVALFRVFNSHEDWVLRVPTVISFILLAFVNFQIMRRKLGDKVAQLSSLFFLTSTDLLFYFSFQGEIDMFYSLIVYLQIASILWFFETKNYRALFLISYFLVSIGVLTKGLPSIAFQGITLLAIFIYYKRFKQLFNIWHFIGFGMFIFIIGGYFYSYSTYNDPLPYITRLFTESSNRTIAQKSFFDSIIHLFTFPLILLDILAPWLLIAPLFITKSVVTKIKQSNWLMLVIIFFLSNISLYWISPEARDRYLYMFVPFVTTLFAYIIYSHSRDNMTIPKLANVLLIAVMAILIVALPILPFVQPVSTVDNIFLIVGAIFILLGTTLFIYLKSSLYKVHVFILFIVAARIGFNYIVMPLRLKDELRDNYKFHTDQILEVVGDSRFFFHGAIKHSEKDLPFTSLEVVYDELAHYPFQLTYYIEKSRYKVFDFSREKLPDTFYLSEKTNFNEIIGNKEIHYEFNLDKRGFDFVLFKFN